MDWDSIVKTLGSVGVVTGVIAYFAKATFSHFLALDIQRHQKELDSRHQIEIERLKAELKTAAFDTEARLGLLHEKRAGVVCDLYRHLTKVELALGSLDSGVDKDKQFGEVQELIRKFHSFYYENEIYFDRQLCEALSEFGQLAAIMYVFSLRASSREASDAGFIAKLDRIKEDIPKVKDCIKEQFRSLIGVASD